MVVYMPTFGFKRGAPFLLSKAKAFDMQLRQALHVRGVQRTEDRDDQAKLMAFSLSTAAVLFVDSLYLVSTELRSNVPPVSKMPRPTHMGKKPEWCRTPLFSLFHHSSSTRSCLSFAMSEATLRSTCHASVASATVSRGQWTEDGGAMAFQAFWIRPRHGPILACRNNGTITGATLNMRFASGARATKSLRSSGIGSTIDVAIRSRAASSLGATLFPNFSWVTPRMRQM